MTYLLQFQKQNTVTFVMVFPGTATSPSVVMVNNRSSNYRELTLFSFLWDRNSFFSCQINFDMVQAQNNKAIKDENNYYQL